ncbi:MAG: nitrilase-related carbon-nitrogen hydrolase [Pseudomonadota bacterium]
MHHVTVAATQFACTWDLPANAGRAEAALRQAAALGAQVVLVQELFATPYFCIEEHPRHLDLAPRMDWHPLIGRFSGLARNLGVVLSCSYFERAGQRFSIALRGSARMGGFPAT